MVTISVETHEGVLVYVGSDPDGNSKWKFLKRLNNGQIVPTRKGPPKPLHRRFERQQAYDMG